MPRRTPNRPPEPEKKLSPEEEEKAALATKHAKIASSAAVTLRMDHRDAKRILFEMLQNPEQPFTADHLFQLLYSNQVITSHTQAEVSSYVYACENMLAALAMRFAGKTMPDLPFIITRIGDAPQSAFDKKALMVPRGVYKMTPRKQEEAADISVANLPGPMLRRTISNSIRIAAGKALKH